MVDHYRRSAGYVTLPPQGREAGRTAGAGADEVGVGRQPQKRHGARHDLTTAVHCRVNE
jgi:hypothetical protein